MVIFFKGICFYVCMNILVNVLLWVESHDFSFMLSNLPCHQAQSMSTVQSLISQIILYSFWSFPPEQKHASICFLKK